MGRGNKKALFLWVSVLAVSLLLVPVQKSEATSVFIGANRVLRGETPFSMVFITDTQLYSESYPDVFLSMSDWILDNRSAKNIQYVLHGGDVVNDRKKSGQWRNAQAATEPLIQALPFFVVPGNHDSGTASPSLERFSALYGPEVFEEFPYYGGFYKDGMGRYDLVDIDGHTFIIAGLGYAYTDESVAWLDKALKKHADRTAILCFHSYLNTDAKLTSHGRELFEKIVWDNKNVRLILCGHKHGVTRRTSAIDDDGDGDIDRQVQVILADHQAEGKGGGGYIRLLAFNPKKQTVSVTAYSPYLDQYRNGEDETFTFPMVF